MNFGDLFGKAKMEEAKSTLNDFQHSFMSLHMRYISEVKTLRKHISVLITELAGQIVAKMNKNNKIRSH